MSSMENTTTVAAVELEVMYCVEKLLGSSNVWGMRRRQGRGRMGSESSRKWGEQKGPRGAASSSFHRAFDFEATKSRRNPNKDLHHNV